VTTLLLGGLERRASRRSDPEIVRYISDLRMPLSRHQLGSTQHLTKTADLKDQESICPIFRKRGSSFMRLRYLQVAFTMVVLLSATSVLHSQEATVASMADDLAKSLTAGTHKRVAVVDFTDLNSTVTPLGKYFAQDLEVALAISQTKVDLVNRSRLNELMKENKLDATGLTDPETARKLGKIAGVEALIVGTVTPLDQTVKLDIEAIGTEDARVLTATSRNVLKTRDILALLGQADLRATPDTNISEYPAHGITNPPLESRTLMPKRAEAQEVSFLLRFCYLSNSSVICDFTVTNEGDDRGLSISAGWGGRSKTKIFDDRGRETLVSNARLGSHTQGDYGVQSELIAGVQTPVELVFEHVSSAISSISKIEVGGEVEGKDFSVSFKAVPLSRSR
jgi:hypothetical protein